MKLVVFALGHKGLKVVRALVTAARPLSLHCVIGRDEGVVEDYSDELARLCRESSTPCSFREEGQPDAASFDHGLAVGWRWMVRGAPQDWLVVLHDSLLPRYRGFAPLVSALLNREPEVGVTAILGVDEYDRGRVLAQSRMPVSYPTTVEREIERMSDLYATTAVSLVGRLSDEPAWRGVEQDEAAATYSLWRDEADYRIDWASSACEIAHFISCVGFPYKGASTLANGRLVRVSRGVPEADVRIENRTPGKTIFVRNGLPTVVCGEGLLRIEEAAGEDGKPLLPLTSVRVRFA